jgi:hypothetical protein
MPRSYAGLKTSADGFFHGRADFFHAPTCRSGNGIPVATLQVTMFITSPARAKHFAAMVLIGDGVMAIVHPQKDAHAWKKGPKVWQNLMHQLAERPNLTRVIGAAQIVGGIWWALHQDEDDV